MSILRSSLCDAPRRLPQMGVGKRDALRAGVVLHSLERQRYSGIQSGSGAVR